MRRSPWSDEQVEHIIGRLLQIGVLLSATVVLAGGILYFAQSGRAEANYQTFQAQRFAFRGILPTARGTIHLDGRSVIEVGLLLLIATPVARVAFSIVAFWDERDWIYVVITGFVFVILLYSLSGWNP